MKKIFILSIFACLFLCGCTTLKDMSIEEVVDNGTHRTVEVYNKYRQGYKYNLPKGLSIVDNSEYNEVIVSNKYKYFLYIDAVSYHNKIIEKYEENDKSHISMAIDYEDKFGYLEINNVKDDEYLVEIMYNYAKIEVIVREIDAKVVVSNALSILASIDFNNDVLKNLLDEEVSQFSEFEIDIFDTVTSADSQYLGTVEEKEEDEEEVHDSDYIN